MNAWNSSADILLLFPITLFTLASVALWLMLLHYMSKTGGWSGLAQKHRLSQRFAGHKWRFCSAIFKDEVRYWGVLTIGASEQGLYLALLKPFSWRHPPMLIPWTLVRRPASGGWARWGAALELGEPPCVQVTISPSILRLLEQTAPAAFSRSELADAPNGS